MLLEQRSTSIHHQHSTATPICFLVLSYYVSTYHHVVLFPYFYCRSLHIQLVQQKTFLRDTAFSKSPKMFKREDISSPHSHYNETAFLATKTPFFRLSFLLVLLSLVLKHTSAAHTFLTLSLSYFALGAGLYTGDLIASTEVSLA